MNDLTINVDLLQPLVPFRDLLPSHLEKLIEESEILCLFPGDVLFEGGQFDDFHYYLLTGELHARDSENGSALIFGEASLLPIMSEQPRPYTLVAASQSTVLKVSRQRLDQLLTWSQASEYLLVELAAQRHRDEDAAWLATILKSNLFLKVPPTNVAKIIEKVETKLVGRDEVVIRQGEIGDCCYFIKEGDAEVRRHTDTSGESQHVADISAGRCFGEDALLQETVRNATVTMRSDGVLLTLSKSDFLQLLREPEIPKINWSDVRHKLQDYVIIDVRTEGEYAAGHLQWAVNMPLNLLQLKRRLLDKSRPCLLYCDTGRRSATAARFLNDQGLSAIALSGGIIGLESELLRPCWSTRDYVLQNGAAVKGQ